MNYSNWRVLLVDDNTGNLKMLNDLMMFYNLQVTTASSGQEALTAVQHMPQPFRFILSDISMHHMDGYELCNRLRALPELNNTPIIATTALAMAGDEQKALANGFDGYLSKPLPPPKELMERIILIISKFMKDKHAAQNQSDR